MDVASLNKALLDLLKNKLPNGVNIVTVLSDILPLGKEAIYRRLREEVPFTFLEAAIISKKLGISLDQATGYGLSDNSYFELKFQRHYKLRDIDYHMAYEYIETLKYAKQDPKAEQVFTSTTFPDFPANRYYLLGKLFSFKWMYLNEIPANIKSFKDMEYPDSLYKVMRDTIEETMNINTCYIWDEVVFQCIVKDLKYYKEVQLIRQEDILEIKKELYELLDFLERIATKGRFDSGKKVQIYISNVNSDASYIYLETQHLYLSMINAFALNYVVALDKMTLDRVKERIHSMKRVSTLISESGEIQRMLFFKQQREFVDTL